VTLTPNNGAPLPFGTLGRDANFLPAIMSTIAVDK